MPGFSPAYTMPNRSGNGTYSNLRAHDDDDSGDEDPADLDPTTSTFGIHGWNVSQPDISMARATGIPAPLPISLDLPAEDAEGLSDNEAAYREDDRECDIALTVRGPLWNSFATAHDDSFTLFEAIDGDTIMQGIPRVTRPSSLPAHPISPLVGPPATAREGRLSQPIG